LKGYLYLIEVDKVLVKKRIEEKLISRINLFYF